MIVKTGFGVDLAAAMRAAQGVSAGIGFISTWKFECFEYAGGPRLWVVEERNLTTNEGLNDALSKYFKGSSYTASFFVGLVDNASFTAFAAGDTAAQINGSNGWIELTAYSESVRQTLTLGSVASQSVDNTGSPAVFTANATKTIKGGFVVTNSTKGGTSGVLYCEAAFTGGNQPVVSGNVVNVTVTLTASSV